MRNDSFKGQVAVVTGGSRGIGRAIALELAERGAHVAFTYLRNHQAARETAAELEARGVRALSARSHLGEPEAVAGFFSRVGEAFGRVDILINNAASGVQRSALDLEPKHWDWVMAVNARGPWLCARHAAAMMESGGRMVSITSLGSSRTLPYYMSVGVSKAALETLTRYLAAELAPRGIRVNAVAGGYVETEALQHFPNREDMLGAARSKTPAGRLVAPEDVARVATFLCSPDADMIRGQIVTVDGGFSLLP